MRIKFLYIKRLLIFLRKLDLRNGKQFISLLIIFYISLNKKCVLLKKIYLFIY